MGLLIDFALYIRIILERAEGLPCQNQCTRVRWLRPELTTLAAATNVLMSCNLANESCAMGGRMALSVENPPTGS